MVAEQDSLVDMDVCHMYMNYPVDHVTPRVIDTIEFPVEFKAPAEVEIDRWVEAQDHCNRELVLIKDMEPRDIPEALIQLFSKYASQATLGDDFQGDETGLVSDDRDGPNRGVGLDRHFIRSAMECNFVELGNGSFSVAYRLTDDLIIKMNIADDDYVWGDDGGFDWAKACTEIQGNIFAPKITALYQSGRHYAMVCESLVENHDLSAPDGGCFRDLAESHHDEMNFGEYISEMMEYETFVLMAAIDREALIEISHVFDAVALASKSPSDDLSDYNMMVRGKVPVLNDPFAGSKSHQLVEGNSFSWKM
ncbi:hypothetical protein D3C76_78100 [compost metagenome]